MTAPRAREHANPPSPPDRLPPRRGGGSSPSPYICAASAAGWPAGPARPPVARRGLVRSARALSAAACLLLVGALAQPATAQEEEISLVSNLEESGGVSLVNVYPIGFTLVGVTFAEQRIAQQFTTGSNSGGYTLKSVVLNLMAVSTSGAVVNVGIHEDSSGQPGNLLTVLDNPADPFGNNSTAAGNRTFSASPPLSLDPSTKYWVVMSDVNSDPGLDNYDVRVTSSRNETSTQGFTIRNSRHVGKPGSWSENTGTFVKLEVRGTVVIPPGLDVTLHLSDDEPNEDHLAVTVTATVSPATPEAFTVEISASPVAPATGDDFELSTNRTLSFAANATGSTGTVRISPVSDDDPEPNDVVTVSGVVSNPAIPNPDDVRLTILNDDADLPQDIAIDAPEAVDEGAGTVNVTVTLTTGQNSAPVIDAQLFYRPRSETAMSGDDYIRPQGLGNRIAIVPVSAFSANADGTAWVARHSFEIGIVDDGVAEPEETIKFAIYTNSNNSGTKQTIHIRDNDTPVMRNVRVVSGPGPDGVWSAGERVELEVLYSLPVVVEQPSSYDECWAYNADGTCKPPGPYVAVVFRSDARSGHGEVLGVARVQYASGSGTATLHFAYTVGAAEDGARGVEVVDGKVLLRGATIRPSGGGAAKLSKFTRTRVMRVTVRKPGGGAWTAGNKVQVTVKFTGPAPDEPKPLDKVDVNKTGGTPTIGLRLGDPQNRPLARTALYVGGSGSDTLVFEYRVTAGDGRVSAVEVVADSLELSGATIRNKDGYDADLDHPGVVWSSSLALSVRDTAANEGGTLRFTMELAQASKAPVTVDYETADGTATAGQDYTAKRGTVTFAPGRTRKTVAVPVLRDEAAEDAETMQLRLSAASGALIADGVATGTIENADHLQRAWLARFGRTAATHVTDAVSDRLRGTPGQESHLTVGGYRLPLGQPDADGAEPATQADSLASLMTGLAGVLGLGSGHAGGTGVDPGGGGLGWDAWPNAGRDPRLGQSPSVNLDLRRLLLGSSFRLSLGAAATGSAGPRLTAWGRVAGTTFDGRDGIDGRDGTLSLNGDVLTGTVGVDGEWDRLLAGLAVAHSRGDGSYTMPVAGGDDSGNLEQTLTSIHPYLRYAVNDRLDVWGLFGYGWGELDLEMDDGMTIETDTNLVMGAFGGRGILLSAAESGGFQLATRTDAMLTRTTSDKVAEMESAEADAHRLRLVLEGSRGFAWAEGRRLTPTMEVGLRHDWGDAETGFGLELGGRVQYVDPALGLTIDAAVRGLLAHEDRDYEEWGASGTVRIDPGAGGQGLALTLAPAWGATASGVDGLWSRQTTAGLAPQGNRAAPVGRLNAEVGYGFAPFGAGLLTPYAGTVLSDGAARTYRVGTRVQLGGPGATGLNLNLEGMRQEPAGQQPVNQGLRVQITWGF